MSNGEYDRVRAFIEDCADPGDRLVRRLLDLHSRDEADYWNAWWAGSIPGRGEPGGEYLMVGCSSCLSGGVDGENYIDDGACVTLWAIARQWEQEPNFASLAAPDPTPYTTEDGQDGE